MSDNILKLLFIPLMVVIGLGFYFSVKPIIFLFGSILLGLVVLKAINNLK